MNERIGVVSLGCAKNQVDAEMMLFTLKQSGYKIVADPAMADVVIVNTCGFIESAKQESPGGRTADESPHPCDIQ